MFKLLLIWRYFLHKRVALLAVVAVALVVMMVLVVLSVMSGLLDDVRGRNHGWAGDVVISSESLVGFDHYEEFLALLKEQDYDLLPIRVRHYISNEEFQSFLKAQEQIEAATPVVTTYGLAGTVHMAVQLYGVRMDEWCAVTRFADTLCYQKPKPQTSRKTPPSFQVPQDRLSGQRQGGLTTQERRRGCIAGVYLASRLYTGINSKVELERIRQLGLNPANQVRLGVTVFGLTSRGALTGSGMGEYQSFWYVDDSDSGLVDVDMAAMYVDFDELQSLCFMDGSNGEPARANEIRIKLKEGVSLAAGRESIKSCWLEFVRQKGQTSDARLLTEAKVQSWKEFRRSNIAPMEREKSLMIMVFLMIAGVAVFIVFAIFYMIVTEKIKDLGIIKSIGGSNFSVSQIFLGYGILVGLTGAVLGLIFGTLIVTNSNEIETGINSFLIWCNELMSAWHWDFRFDSFNLWDPEVYAIERIPDIVHPAEATVIALAAILASLAGAALPARRAAKLQVAEALRVE